MAKRQIHINEQQLHRLVESALNELDWRTYASAANKRMNQARTYAQDNNTNITNSPNYKKSYALNTAATKTFNNKHGFDPQNKGTGWYMNSDDKGDPNARNTNANKFTNNNNGYGIDNPYRQGQYKGHSSDKFTFANDSDFKEITDFQSGKSQYNKGTHQWESVTRRVAENVIKRINESYD